LSTKYSPAPASGPVRPPGRAHFRGVALAMVSTLPGRWPTSGRPPKIKPMAVSGRASPSATLPGQLRRGWLRGSPDQLQCNRCDRSPPPHAGLDNPAFYVIEWRMANNRDWWPGATAAGRKRANTDGYYLGIGDRRVHLRKAEPGACAMVACEAVCSGICLNANLLLRLPSADEGQLRVAGLEPPVVTPFAKPE
jgi:hypothetical protein